MDVTLAKVQRGLQVAEVVARVRPDTVEIWVGQCLEVVIDHDELLSYLERPQWNFRAFEPIRFHYYPGRMSGISIGTRHHALADMEPLKEALALQRDARRAQDARTGDVGLTSCLDTEPLPIAGAVRSRKRH